MSRKGLSQRLCYKVMSKFFFHSLKLDLSNRLLLLKFYGGFLNFETISYRTLGEERQKSSRSE